MCDHYAVSKIQFPHSDFDHEAEWDHPPWDRLVGLVVKASASRAEDPGFESRSHRDFSGVESYQ